MPKGSSGGLRAEVEVGGPFDTQAYLSDGQGVRVGYTLTNDGDRPLLVVLERGHEEGDTRGENHLRGPDVGFQVPFRFGFRTGGVASRSRTKLFF